MKGLTPKIIAMYHESCEAIAKTARGDEWRGRLAGVYSDLNVHIRMESGEVSTFRPDEVKLVLRRLSSMSEEEAREFKKLVPYIDHIGFASGRWQYWEHEEEGNHETRRVCKVTSDINGLPLIVMPYLLSKSFDLFNLIDSGLAIEKEPVQGE